MKKKIVIASCVLVLFLIVLLLCLNSNKYICRIIDSEDNLKTMTESTLSAPFVDDNQRNELIEKAIHKRLKGSNSFTYEIMSEHMGFYEGNDTLLYWIKVVDNEGIEYVFGVLIQQR